jgi:hypothetical protein
MDKRMKVRIPQLGCFIVEVQTHTYFIVDPFFFCFAKFISLLIITLYDIDNPLVLIISYK